jgi:hypothetical protein
VVRSAAERHHEALLFFAFSGVGVLLSMAPLWISSYVFELRVPHVSLTIENIADFISAYLLGNLLQMAFRFWAFRRWVFPDEFGRAPDKALESTFTAGGIAEAMEFLDCSASPFTCAGVGAGDGEEGVGQHGQGDVLIPAVVIADLVLIQTNSTFGRWGRSPRSPSGPRPPDQFP